MNTSHLTYIIPIPIRKFWLHKSIPIHIRGKNYYSRLLNP